MADEHTTAATNGTYTQAEVDALTAIVGRQARRAESVVWGLEQIVKDRSITAAMRDVARTALEDARAIVRGEEVPPVRHAIVPGATTSARLEAPSGFVHQVDLPDFQRLPDIIVWGQRMFLILSPAERRYREVFGFHVP